MNCYPRNIVVLEQLRNFDKWKGSVSYGYKWMVMKAITINYQIHTIKYYKQYYPYLAFSEQYIAVNYK
jgi:hypothetical protein